MVDFIKRRAEQFVLLFDQAKNKKVNKHIDIRRQFQISTTCQNDMINTLDEDLKISGTAAKLGKDAAYHHCTVLVDVNECVLHDALSSKAVSIFLK